MRRKEHWVYISTTTAMPQSKNTPSCSKWTTWLPACNPIAVGRHVTKERYFIHDRSTYVFSKILKNLTCRTYTIDETCTGHGAAHPQALLKYTCRPSTAPQLPKILHPTPWNPAVSKGFWPPCLIPEISPHLWGTARCWLDFSSSHESWQVDCLAHRSMVISLKKNYPGFWGLKKVAHDMDERQLS